MTVDGAKLLVAVTDKNIVALGLADGKPVWQTRFVGTGMGGANDPSPVVDGQTLYYAGTGRGVTAVKIEKKG